MADKITIFPERMSTVKSELRALIPAGLFTLIAEGHGCSRTCSGQQSTRCNLSCKTRHRRAADETAATFWRRPSSEYVHDERIPGRRQATENPAGCCPSPTRFTRQQQDKRRPAGLEAQLGWSGRDRRTRQIELEETGERFEPTPKSDKLNPGSQHGV